MNIRKKNGKSSASTSKSLKDNFIFEPFKEEEKLKVLLEQLRIANERWFYFEERRLKTFELFLSYSGLTTIGLSLEIYSGMVNIVKWFLPLILFSIGYIFFALFWYREYYFQLSKSWCRRIEQEIQLIYKNQQYRRTADYDGAFRLYYYETCFDNKNQKYNDWSTYIHGIAIAFITTTVTLIACARLNIVSFSLWNFSLVIASTILIFLTTREIILKHLTNMYKCNSDKWDPKISDGK